MCVRVWSDGEGKAGDMFLMIWICVCVCACVCVHVCVCMCVHAINMCLYMYAPSVQP